MVTAVATDKPSQGDSVRPPLPINGKGNITDAQINGIVDQISGLTLLQAADLVAALKVHTMSLLGVVLTTHTCGLVLGSIKYPRSSCSCCSSRAGSACRS